jgi:hypothetical protein
MISSPRLEEFVQLEKTFIQSSTERGTATETKPLSPALSPLVPRRVRDKKCSENSSRRATKLGYCSTK